MRGHTGYGLTVGQDPFGNAFVQAAQGSAAEAGVVPITAPINYPNEAFNCDLTYVSNSA